VPLTRGAIVDARVPQVSDKFTKDYIRRTGTLPEVPIQHVPVLRSKPIYHWSLTCVCSRRRPIRRRAAAAETRWLAGQTRVARVILFGTPFRSRIEQLTTA